MREDTSIWCEKCGHNRTTVETTTMNETVVKYKNCSSVRQIIENEKIRYEGELFMNIKENEIHSAWRQEYPVLLKEHYVFKTNESESTTGSIKFSRDEIMEGWNTEIQYKCSCGCSYPNRNELEPHLQAVIHNRGSDSVETI